MSLTNRLFSPLRGTHDPDSLVRLIQERAEGWADKTVYTFLTSNDDHATLTFGELEQQARALAARLQDAGAQGRPVILLCPVGIDYIVAFWASLLAGAIAVPAYPPAPKRMTKMLPRIQAIIDDCRCELALATAPIMEMRAAMAEASPRLGSLRWICTDRDGPGDDLGDAAAWRDPGVKRDSLAFLQYTSGSTSTPKGVMVTHGNLVHNSQAIYEVCAGANTHVSWLPPYHDMGLIGTLIQVVYAAGAGHFMAPLTFLRQPLRWLETISRTRSQVSVAPNFAYQQCVSKITDAQIERLDLSGWESAYCGAEPIRPHTVDAFCERFAQAGFRREAFRPCYGLAEATLMVTGWTQRPQAAFTTVDQRALEERRIEPIGADDEHASTVVSCGLPVPDTRIAIADPTTGRLVETDRVGEIWVSSPSCANGYWGRPDVTKQTFGVSLVGVADSDRFMRTGDLGFVDDQGELHVVARIKDLIIFRGRNVYPEDVELVCQRAYPELRAGGVAAFGVEVEDREEVVVVQEVEGRHRKDAARILATVRSALAGEPLEITPHTVLLVRAGALPKTSSGKIQRHASRRLFLDLEFPVVAASVIGSEMPATEANPEAVESVLRDLLKRRCGTTILDLNSPLSALAIDFPSLCLFAGELQRRCGRRVALGTVLEEPRLAVLLAAAGGDADAWTANANQRVESTRVATTPRQWTSNEVEGWMIEQLAIRLGLDTAVIDPELPFADIGLDSASSVELAGSLAEFLQRPVSPTLVWERPSLRAAARYLAGEDEPRVQPAESVEGSDPIAVVGLGCRFPGAPDVASFWSLLVDGRDAVTQLPDGRWESDWTTRDGLAVTPWGGHLDQIDGFDPQFFGISHREAERMDPQQRLLLEVSWEALENACISPRGIAGSDTGVFVGISNCDYWTLQTRDPGDLDIHSCTGNASSGAANRISYALDLHGPSLALDTACSASLVAVHQASEALKRGECSLALAGGVNLMITADLSIAFTQARMLSPQGRCGTFDEGADGYVRGEGCGMVVLARLSEASRRGLPVLAIIEGSAVRHDGRSNGMTAPNGMAQESVIRAALATAGVSPSQVDYVETHGTGTPLGDPMEARVLATIYGAERGRDDPCLLGSVKTNIGHLESAAGIAGLIKAVLCVRHGKIPAHLHCHHPSTHLKWDDVGVRVVQEVSDWHANGRSRRAAVSSFGFGGTIAHLVLAEAPAMAEVKHVRDDWQILPVSAHKATALAAQRRDLADHIQRYPGLSISELCTQVARVRSDHRLRQAVVARSTADLLPLLVAETAAVDTIPQDRPAIAFCFTGQGSQYPRMAANLMRSEPVFRDVIERCDRVSRPRIGIALGDLLGAHPNEVDLSRTEIQQPLLYALECGLFAVWRSWGVMPDLVLGHSLGELAAAQCVGSYSLEDGMTLVLARAEAMAAQQGSGGMLACLGAPEAVRERLKGFRGRLWIAAVNGPRNLVVSGHRDALEAFSTAPMDGVRLSPLPVSGAFHTPMMAGAAAALEQTASAITMMTPQIPLVSTVDGRLHETALAPDHFVRHLLEPVDFQAAIRAAADRGCNAFVEIGPGNSLLQLGRSCLADDGKRSSWLPSLEFGKPERQVLLSSLARLWETGMDLDWTRLYPVPAHDLPHLPTYPFQRTRCWNAPSPPLSRSNVMQPSNLDTRTSTTPANTPDAARDAVLSQALELFRSQNDTLARLVAGRTSTPAANDDLHAALSTTGVAEPSERSDEDTEAEVERDILAHLAKVSGIPIEDIALDLRLASELGLDSLMHVELDRALSQRWPAMADADRTLLGTDPRVREVVALVCAALDLPGNAHAPEIRKPVAAEQSPTPRVAAETRIEDWAEFRSLESRLAMLQTIGDNPYGRIHEGFNSADAILDGRKVLNFAAFNYCGLSHHPRVLTAAKQAIDTYGTSPSATPLLFGETPLHRELEEEIADFLGTEAAVVFASGHSTSVAIIGHLMDEPDLVIHDQYIHDSTIRGALLSGARRRSFRHNDWRELDQTLKQIRDQFRRVLIVSEGVYSQDGDLGCLPELVRVKNEHQCLLMIDEAHSIGTLGRSGAGAGDHYGVDRRDVDIWMGTLSKALGSCGGYIAASHNLVRFLKYTTPLLIFSTGITPANAAAALAAIRVLRDEPQRVGSLQEKSRRFLAMARSRELDTGPSHDSPVIPIIVGSWERAIRLSNLLGQQGINVMPIGYPAVPEDQCRLRFFINVDHRVEDFEMVLDRLVDNIRTLDDDEQPNLVSMRASI